MLTLIGSFLGLMLIGVPVAVAMAAASLVVRVLRPGASCRSPGTPRSARRTWSGR